VESRRSPPYESWATCSLNCISQKAEALVCLCGRPEGAPGRLNSLAGAARGRHSPLASEKPEFYYAAFGKMLATQLRRAGTWGSKSYSSRAN